MSSFNFAKGLEIRLSLSPATLFLDVSLPNHTKMFELVHMVTSMEDFACNRPPNPTAGAWGRKRHLRSANFPSPTLQ